VLRSTSSSAARFSAGLEFMFVLHLEAQSDEETTQDAMLHAQSHQGTRIFTQWGKTVQ